MLSFIEFLEWKGLSAEGDDASSSDGVETDPSTHVTRSRSRLELNESNSNLSRNSTSPTLSHEQSAHASSSSSSSLSPSLPISSLPLDEVNEVDYKDHLNGKYSGENNQNNIYRAVPTFLYVVLSLSSRTFKAGVSVVKDSIALRMGTYYADKDMIIGIFPSFYLCPYSLILMFMTA